MRFAGSTNEQLQTAVQRPGNTSMSKMTLADFFEDHRKAILGATGVIIFAIVWELLSNWGVLHPLFFSSPSRVIAEGYRLTFVDGQLINHIKVSSVEFALGFGLSIVVGIAVGLLMGWYRVVDNLLDPFVTLLYSTPRIALLPLFIIWFGVEMNLKVAVIFLSAVFPIIINTLAGVRALDHSFVRVARAFCANDYQTFRTVALPGSVPFILAGLRLGLSRGLVGIVVAEMFASNAGLGYMISVAGAGFRTDRLLVGVLTIAGFAYGLTQLIAWAEGKFDRWRPEKA